MPLVLQLMHICLSAVQGWNLRLIWNALRSAGYVFKALSKAVNVTRFMPILPISGTLLSKFGNEVARPIVIKLDNSCITRGTLRSSLELREWATATYCTQWLRQCISEVCFCTHLLHINKYSIKSPNESKHLPGHEIAKNCFVFSCINCHTVLQHLMNVHTA